ERDAVRTGMGRLCDAGNQQHHAAAREDLRQRRALPGDLLFIGRRLRNQLQRQEREIPGARWDRFAAAVARTDSRPVVSGRRIRPFDRAGHAVDSSPLAVNRSPLTVRQKNNPSQRRVSVPSGKILNLALYYKSVDQLAYSAVAKGKPRSRHAFKPPCKGRMRLIPFFLRSSATRALVASFGQVQ